MSDTRETYIPGPAQIAHSRLMEKLDEILGTGIGMTWEEARADMAEFLAARGTIRG